MILDKRARFPLLLCDLKLSTLLYYLFGLRSSCVRKPNVENSILTFILKKVADLPILFPLSFSPINMEVRSYFIALLSSTLTLSTLIFQADCLLWGKRYKQQNPYPLGFLGKRKSLTHVAYSKTTI